LDYAAITHFNKFLILNAKMWFKRDHRNTSLDDFIGADRKKLLNFIKFASKVAGTIGKQIESDVLDDDLRAKRTYKKYVTGNFEFTHNPRHALTEIKYDGKLVLSKWPTVQTFAYYKPRNWENELENLMATPDLYKYAS